MLYHQMILEKIEETEDEKIIQILSNRLLDYIEGRQKFGPLAVEELISLENSLSHDPDLKPFITQELFYAIHRLIT